MWLAIPRLLSLPLAVILAIALVILEVILVMRKRMVEEAQLYE